MSWAIRKSLHNDSYAVVLGTGVLASGLTGPEAAAIVERLNTLTAERDRAREAVERYEASLGSYRTLVGRLRHWLDESPSGEGS